MAHLSPSAIFSPSVARQQLAAAKDWNYIDGWLAAKFNGKPAPPFERNNDTLKALLVLATLNGTADEDRDLLAKVEAKVLLEIQAKGTKHSDIEILTALEENLTQEGRIGLDALSSAGVALNQPFANIEQLARKLVDLQVATFDLDQASDRIALLHKHLTSELEQVEALLQELRGDAYQPPADLPRQTLDFQRKTKVLAAKLPELADRVSALLAAGTPKPSIQDVKVEEDQYSEQMARVKTLETQVKGFHGLPHDTDLARLKLEELRVELKELSRQRDRLFEGLVERESPRKYKS
jgi:HAUS augmin-like complex subunit 1